MATKRFAIEFDEEYLNRISASNNYDPEQVSVTEEEFVMNLTAGLLRAKINNYEIEQELDQQPGYSQVVITNELLEDE